MLIEGVEEGPAGGEAETWREGGAELRVGGWRVAVACRGGRRSAAVL